MSRKPEQATTIVIPLALTDFAKALRELIGAFRDGAEVIRDGMQALARRRARGAASDLDVLSFQPGGFLRHLRRIAAGEGTTEDVAALDEFTHETADEVSEKIHTLRKYRDTVREQCGQDAANKLSNVIDGPAGKFVIRYEIAGLAQMWRDGKQADCPAQATKILAMIAEFNDELAGLHDAIFPPRGAPK